MGSSLRFSRPVTAARPYRSHRYDVWSPKIRRRLTLFGEVALKTWVFLEATSSVEQFCERPMIIEDTKPPRVVDFWVLHRNFHEEIWLNLRQSELMDGASEKELFPAFHIWASSKGIEVKLLASDAIELDSMAFDNWAMILHHLAANFPLLGEALIARVLQECKGGTTFRSLEATFPTEDPQLVRSAAFSLIHSGKVTCAELGAAPICSSTRLAAI